MDDTLSFGRWLMGRRQALDLTREDVAALVGCAPVTVAKIERDERRPSRQMAERLADVLRFPPEWRDDFMRRARGVDWEPEVPEKDASPEAAPFAPAIATRGDLPASPTSFIGREADVAKVRALLWRADLRLLTLTGPPGIGKTRLALSVAASMRDDFADGALWVPLAPVTDPTLVASSIAHALGLREATGQTVEESLRAHLRDKQMLLLVDNVEHLMPSVHLLSSLLAAAPRLKILATSREVLRLYGEQEYRVPPLEVPSSEYRVPSEPNQLGTRYSLLGTIPSVALFVQRAQAVKPDFALTPANAPLVAQICARLDGLPLAIELAAARTRLFDLEGMLARLENKLRMLTGGPRDLPARQQTLQGAIEWSYSLLSEDEKTLFRRLSAFVGGCELEAIEAIYGPGIRDQGSGTSGKENLAPVFDLTSSLLDKSLVQRREEDPEGRFVMLETIREYAGERLRESGEAEVVRRRLAEYYARLGEEAEPQLRGPHQKLWLDRLEREHDNIRFALGWALERHGELAQRMSAPLWRFWSMRGYIREGRDWFAKARAAAPARTSARAGVCRGGGSLATTQTDYDQARALLHEALDIYEELGDRLNASRTLNNLGLVEWQQERLDRAREYFALSLEISRSLGDKWGAAAALSNLGMIEHNDITREYLQEGYSLLLELGDRRNAAVVLNNLGVRALWEGKLDEARTIWEECASIYRELNNKESLGLALTNLAVVARDSGRYDDARRLNREGLDMLFELGDHRLIGHTIDRMAGMAVIEGYPEKAARLFGAAARLMSDWKMVMPMSNQQDHDRHEAQARATLGDERYELLWREGGQMNKEQAIELGLSRSA